MIVRAEQFLDSTGNIVESAARLAEHVVGLESNQSIEISFAGVRGISSSYFNVLLRRIADAKGIDSIGSQILLQFESEAQRQVYLRSLQALKKAVA